MTNYYKVGRVEAIDVIESVVDNDNLTVRQSFAVGNALKYLLRLGKKSEDIEGDLYKAENYLHRARTGKWINESRI